MSMFYGKKITKKDIRSYVGDMSQISRITDFRFESGRAEGMRGLEVVNGSGLQFTVLPSRCLDIAQASYNGIPLSFISKSGISAPGFYEKEGLGFLKNFTCGLITTCGLTYMGAPCNDEGEKLGLHGRISNIPAQNCSYRAEWVGDRYVLKIKGEMREASMFGDNMVLIREITTELGSNHIHINDKIENQGFSETPFMLLYHCNFGYPFIDENTILEIKSKTVKARDERAQEGIADWSVFSNPVPGFTEQVYYFDPPAEDDGYAQASLYNSKLGKNGLKVTVKFKKEALPYLSEWKQLGEGDYVVGLEPGTWLPEGRAKARKAGELKFLKAGESYDSELDYFIEEC
jgi:galactose mutarotase-like enzyme